MQKILSYIYGVKMRLFRASLIPAETMITWLRFYLNGVHFKKFRTRGIPKVLVEYGGEFSIGFRLKMNNREMANPIGRFRPCSFVVGKNAKLLIGNNVGISASAIFCQMEIVIEDDVNIGGNVAIYDTDFHSKHPVHRLDKKLDKDNTVKKPVRICRNAFIGAHSTILKGVTIGQNSIVGACSVVTKDIPAGEIWAGNPARFISKTQNIGS